MALAPVAYTLYTRVMRHNPADASWPNRDRFVLSCGHASMLLYSMLYLCGYGLELSDLESFRQIGSPCAGHPEYGHAAGIEATTGPLGQGISTCVGLALAERMLAARFNRDGHEIVDHHTFTIVSDGDLEEGISSEASSIAGHLGLGRLIAFYDDNHISIEGNTALAFSENVGARYEAYGWHVQHLGEDLTIERIEEAARAAMAVPDRPSLIICRTHIGFGSPNKQDSASAHGSPLGEEEVRLTKENYGWPLEPAFYVPPEALEHFRATIGVGEAAQAEWDERFARYRSEYPELAAELEAICERRVPELAPGFLKRFEPGTKMATRKASEEVLQVAAAERRRVDRRLRRPRALDAHAARRRRRRRARQLRQPQPPLRDPRALDGGDRQRPRAERVPRLRRDLPGLLRLHEGVGPARRADADPEHLLLHARLDRARRGRTDAPADRAARGAARDPQRQRRAAGRRPRDGARVELRAARDRDADRARALAPGRCRCSTPRRSPSTRSIAAPTCCGARARRARRRSS